MSKRLRNDPDFFSNEVDNIKRPGDDMQTSYELKPELKWERLQMIESKQYTTDQILAFTLANKADMMLNKGFELLALAIDYAFRALKHDPLCVDSIRVITKIMHKIPQVDHDTIICCYREILYTFRKLTYNDLLFKHPGDAIHQYKLRSYVRLLKDIAYSAITGEKNEVAVFALEEMLRVDNEDYHSARFYLILTYLKIIGRENRIGGVIIKRTEEQLQKLVEASLPHSDGPIFETDKDAFIYRWLQLILAFQKKDEELLIKLAKEEEQKAPNLIRYIFNEVKLQFLQETEEVKKYSEPLHFTLMEWPEFIIKLHNILRTEDKKFNQTVTRFVPSFSDSSSINFKTQMGKMGFDFLERGRNSQRSRQYMKGITLFTMSKRYFVEAMKPSQRWYLNAPFALVSNRGTCAENYKQWALARHDTRFTLFMKPDHVRSYERLPKIAAEFHAKELAAMLEDFVSYVKFDMRNRTMDEWRQLSKKAVALISIEAIVLSRIGKLDDEKINELMKVGIEDMYTSCNVGPDILPPLPWLSDDDNEYI